MLIHSIVKKIMLIAVVACNISCATSQLNNKTMKLATTTNDLFYIQILNNIALTIDSPTSLPHYDTPASGTVQIQYSASAGYTPQWGYLATGAGLSLLGHTILNQQQVPLTAMLLDQESWQMSPVADPDRLFLMHCAYLKATGNATPDREFILNQYYTARNTWVKLSIDQNDWAMKQSNIVNEIWQNVDRVEAQHQPSTDPMVELKYLREKYVFFSPPGGSRGGGGSPAGGAGASKPPLPIIIPYQEYLQPGWFSVGRKKDVPRDACFVGHHDQTYVWVTSENMEGLARFTMAILDFANIGNSGSTPTAAPPQTLGGR